MAALIAPLFAAAIKVADFSPSRAPLVGYDRVGPIDKVSRIHRPRCLGGATPVALTLLSPQLIHGQFLVVAEISPAEPDEAASGEDKTVEPVYKVS